MSMITNRTRRALTLVELVVMLPILVAVEAMFVLLFPTLIHDVPATWRSTQAGRQIDAVMSRLARDIDQAQALPDTDGGKLIGNDTILIQTPKGMIRYQLAPGAITRSDDVAGSQPQTWSVPEAAVSWTVLWTDGRARAVEVRSAVKVNMAGHSLDRLANSRVFYLNSFPGRRVPG